MLTIILIEEMLKLSINYLNYEKVIRIDVKSNSEYNNDLYIHIISNINLYLLDIFLTSGKYEHTLIELDGCSSSDQNKYGGYDCLSSDKILEKILDCLVKIEK